MSRKFLETTVLQGFLAFGGWQKIMLDIGTTRLRRPQKRRSSKAHQRPPLPAPTSVTMANAPLSERDGVNKQLIWVARKQEYFCKRDWTRTLETHLADLPAGLFLMRLRPSRSRHPRDERGAFAREVRALSCAPRRMAASTAPNSILRGSLTASTSRANAIAFVPGMTSEIASQVLRSGVFAAPQQTCRFEQYRALLQISHAIRVDICNFQAYFPRPSRTLGSREHEPSDATPL